MGSWYNSVPNGPDCGNLIKLERCPMKQGGFASRKAGYTRPQLREYGSFAKLTASGSGPDIEVFPDNMGMNMMRRP